MNVPEIHAALMAVNKAITEANGPAMSEALDRIERFLASHRIELHPQLAHFLERRSYAKALAWLESGNPAGRGQGSHGNVA
jgi:hypothetical protein